MTKTDGTSGKTDFVFTVTRTGNLGVKSSFHYATVNGTAKAGKVFLYSSGWLSFAKGASKLTIIVPVLGTKVYEPNETFLVDLQSPGHAVLAKAQGTGTIISGVKKPTHSQTAVSHRIDGSAGKDA